MKASSSLDSWREYFRRGDSDIFGIINNAIMVAATDCPNKFKSKRDEIAELLFSCKVTRCIGCDHLELSVPTDDEANHHRGDTAAGGSKESKANSSRGDNNHSNQILSNYTFDEAEALSNEIEQFSLIYKEVGRIKEILLNKEDESNSVLLESLRQLKLMSLNVDVLKSTEIGKAVNGLRKHGFDKIRQLAKSLITDWKELVDEWVNTKNEIAGTEGTPESANPSVVDEQEAFPALPYDVDIFTQEPNGFEISHFFDSLDFDGNLCNPEELKTSREQERRPQNIAKRKPEGSHMRIQDAPIRTTKPSDVDETRRPLKQSTEQRMKNETVSAHKSEKPVIQRKSIVTEQKRKAPGPQQEKLKGLNEDAKFEFAKRKLQESYQQHENAKKQRTIQVLEMIPKKGSAQKPQLKRPVRK